MVDVCEQLVLWCSIFLHNIK